MYLFIDNMNKHITYDKIKQFDQWYKHVIKESDFIKYHNVS